MVTTSNQRVRLAQDGQRMEKNEVEEKQKEEEKNKKWLFVGWLLNVPATG